MTRIFLIGYMGAGKTTLGKAFQKPMKDGIELLNTIQDVYLDSSITIA